MEKIKQEVLENLQDLKTKVSKGKQLSENDLMTLLLTSLIEEESK